MSPPRQRRARVTGLSSSPHDAAAARSVPAEEVTMETLIERCAGLDVHQGTVVAAIRVLGANRKAHTRTKTFSTMPDELRALRSWLQDEGVTHATMEGTGVYWIP